MGGRVTAGPREDPLARAKAAERLTAHQRRILARRRAYCRALAHANRALSFEDCEDVFAETLERDAVGLPHQLSPRDAHHWFSRRLQQRAIDYLRHRDGRRESEKAKRPRYVSLDAPAGEDGTTTLASAIPDADADVSGLVEAREEREQAVAAARQAMERLKPSEQRLLKLRYELPDASMAELAGMLGLTADQASYRLRVAVGKFKKALSTGRLGPECDVARTALRMGPEADRFALARAEAHVAGCWMCRAWQLERAALAWLPFPAFTKLEWLAARLEARLRPWLPLPETAGGAAAAGGASLTLGGGKLAALCGAGAVSATVCAGVMAWPEPSPRRGAPPSPAPPTHTATPPEITSAEPVAVRPPRPTATPAPTREPRPERRREPPPPPPVEPAPTGQVELDTAEVEAPQPAPAPAGSSEFQPSGPGSQAAPPPAQAPAAGGGEFLP